MTTGLIVLLFQLERENFFVGRNKRQAKITSYNFGQNHRAQATAYNNGMAVQGGRPPFTQIAKVICGRAFVSIHTCPVSTPSLRSVGHSPHVHGTQAQIYLATSPYLNVGCNTASEDKKAERQASAKGSRHRGGHTKSGAK
jgi:hypothetical protein